MRAVDLPDGAVGWIEQPQADRSRRTVGLRRDVYTLGFIVHGEPGAVGRGRPGIEGVAGAGGQIDNMNRAAIDGRQVRVGIVLAIWGDLIACYRHPALNRLVVALRQWERRAVSEADVCLRVGLVAA